ncbi:hypothetical protein [Streptomyces sp. ZSW22]|uniref:hypothetical protein n=1 Tax=Streptomyces sp. ZSW22 TaxID=3055050 RepID=UPI0025B0B52B|nr:hypothetical protein [Streptomyces sp. ZSW22]MDN3249745.1 hypothetical protein [Streptomyces sp. ZSW22]
MPVPLRVRVALRRRLQLRTWKQKLFRYAVIGVGLLVIFTAAELARNALGFDTPDLPPSLVDFLFGDSSDRDFMDFLSPEWEKALNFLFVFAMCLWFAFVLVVFLIENHVDLGRRRTQMVRFLLARRYALVYECATTIHACALARQGGESQPARIREITKQLAVVRREVLSAHSSRGSVPLLSHRRKRLKEHQRKVVAALQDLEAQLDRTSVDALRELAQALLTIADRYCQGRSGALLDEEQLTGIPKQRNWEPLRYVIALTLAAGGLVVLAKTGIVPKDAQEPIQFIVLALAFVIAFGGKIRRGLDLLGVITGGP